MENNFFVQSANGYRPADKDEVLEAAAQWSLAKVPKTKRLTNTADAVAHIRLALAGRDSEGFAALWLDLTGRPISVDVISKGDMTEVSTRPRDLVRMALDRNAAAVIVAHNHPSTEGEGKPMASDADIRNAVQLRYLFNAIGVQMLDSVVINRVGYYSIVTDPQFRDNVRRIAREENEQMELPQMLKKLFGEKQVAEVGK